MAASLNSKESRGTPREPLTCGVKITDPNQLK